jgi:tol-pal system protein YbgF
MKITTVFVGAVAAQLILAGTAVAGARDAAEVEHLKAVGAAYLDGRTPAPKIRIPGPRDQQMQARPYIQLAQAGDPRITQLEEQVRQLNGLVEELNFQVLQMQDQLRKMQEDNEFRFQQLEGSGDGIAAPAGTEQRGAADGVETIIENPEGTLTQAPDQSTSPRLGEAPRTLGRITFDAQGRPVSAEQQAVEQPGGVLPGVETGPAPTDNTNVAALPSTEDPEELYRTSYELILSGDYAVAEEGFRDHIARFPSDPRTADAHFWLGEAQLGQQKYREAAQSFLAANRDFPDSRKAPDALLKLGVSLAAMDQRDVACATLAEVGKRYPKASPAILDRARQEQAKASC